MKKLKTSVLIGALIVFSAGGAQAASQYSLTDWGQPTLGYTLATLTAMNNANVAVGDAGIGVGAWRAVVYDGTTLTNLGTLGGTSSYARGINDAGVVVGSSNMYDYGNVHAFYYDGAMHDTGTLTGRAGEFNSSYAYQINSSGTIAGTSNLGPFETHAASWYDGAWHDSASWSNVSYATAINDNGAIAGWFSGANGSIRLFLYDGTLHDLGAPMSSTTASAVAINNQGVMLGNYGNNNFPQNHVFLYDGEFRDLGVLPGFAGALGKDMNEAGYVVGNLQTAKNTLDTSRAFLYDGETMLDLTTLLAANPGGISLISAIAINDHGNILALGSDYHYYLLQPVPVPAAAWLLGSGLAGLAGLTRRRQAA